MALSFLDRGEVKPTPAIANPAIGKHNEKSSRRPCSGTSRFRAAVAPVVLIVRVDFADSPTETVTEVGLNAHVGANDRVGATEQVSDTEWLSAPSDVMVVVEVAGWPGWTEIGAIGDSSSRKSAGLTT